MCLGWSGLMHKMPLACLIVTLWHELTLNRREELTDHAATIQTQSDVTALRRTHGYRPPSHPSQAMRLAQTEMGWKQGRLRHEPDTLALGKPHRAQTLYLRLHRQSEKRRLPPTLLALGVLVDAFRTTPAAPPPRSARQYSRWRRRGRDAPSLCRPPCEARGR